jgi:hypothetical protein
MVRGERTVWLSPRMIPLAVQLKLEALDNPSNVAVNDSKFLINYFIRYRLLCGGHKLSPLRRNESSFSNCKGRGKVPGRCASFELMLDFVPILSKMSYSSSLEKVGRTIRGKGSVCIFEKLYAHDVICRQKQNFKKIFGTVLFSLYDHIYCFIGWQRRIIEVLGKGMTLLER